LPVAQTQGDADTGETYYRHWLATLERLVAEKDVASSETLTRYRDAWDHAADRTPHGSPIELRPEDLRRSASPARDVRIRQALQGQGARDIGARLTH